MTRRGQLVAIVACLAGAALTLYAVTRTWSVRVEQRTGLSDLRTEQTGADVQPWLVGLAVVALAGTGALLATRGAVRRALGVLLIMAGAGIAVGAVLARAALDAGEAGAAAAIWPVACVLGGAAVAVGGVLAARHGHLWPAMSSRYERSTVPGHPAPASAGPEPQSAAGLEHGETNTDPPGPVKPTDNRAFWDALDRGEDPTR
ncbi:Trp biosynthesis-associated membrane protein [Actinoplanes aureus]|uniref:Trp biosynthesis-associated membrane protein n=1 Tax=Actinoplanes aureus TaxID=2792083 RepID=A0A931C7B9_9ACTN|nr:Trp biosynthesis-associated membrane protein [Actinoplanes aureus]MBG0563524.1 Trp biosynthesis-associated membrane protein [Actinoplanes aureus]